MIRLVSRRTSLAIAIALALVTVFLFVLLTPRASAAPNAISDIYISEVYEANGGSGKYVELYNAGATDIDLDDAANDISLRRYSNAGTTGTVVDLTGTIPAGGFYVVGHSDVDTIFGAGTLDQTSGSISHNGNDKYDLFNDNGSVVLDGFAPDNISDATTFASNVVAYRIATALPNNGDWGDTNQPADGADSASGYWRVFDITSSNGNATAVATPGTGSGLEAPAGVPQLLMSEIAVTSTAGEFVEIYNPGNAAVDLTNVYLTDATFAGGPTFYYQIVTGGGGGGSFGDFNARFPNGASIPAGGYQTIAMNGSDDFNTTYAVLPTYELYDDSGAADGVPSMLEAVAGSVNGQGGLTNGGEVAILYYWDGASDLVTDLDYVVWGDKVEAVDKTGVSIDGPDADAITSAYLADTDVATQDVVAAGVHASGSTWQREDNSEGTEVDSGGNGAAGHNETSEDLSATWCESGTPTPNVVSVCPPPTAIEAFIHEVQGSGDTVANLGATTTITGVVVVDAQETDEMSGFFIQEETADEDGLVETSEGIFVSCGTCLTAVDEGNVVRVTGTQAEDFSMSIIDASGGTISVITGGNNLGLITPASIDIPVPASFTDIEDYYEQFEGMLVTFVDELTVTEYFELARYGEMVLSEGGKLTQFTHDNLPDATGYANHLDEVARRRIILNDLNNDQNIDPVYHPQPGGFSAANYIRGGYTVTNLTGALHYAFGDFNIRPQTTSPVTFTASNPRTATPKNVAVTGDVLIATFNVLNYFNGDGMGGGYPTARGAHSPAEFVRQTDKIVAAMIAMDAHVLGLMEIENDSGATGAAAQLVSALNAVAGAGTYDYIATGTVGTDAIKQAIIYQPGVVTPVGSYAVLDTLAFTDPNSTGTPKNRPAVAQTFEVTQVGNPSVGEAFTVVVNHLKSKGSDCGGAPDDDTTMGQGNCNGTRTSGAAEMLVWLATDPTDTATNLGAVDTDILIMGDLNAYKKEGPITTIEAGGYTNVYQSFAGPTDFSYVFSGEWGNLDHALASSSLTSQVVDVVGWHINADEVNLLDYNDTIQDTGEQAWEAKPPTNNLYAADAYRSSDHDPLIIGLGLGATSAVTMQSSTATATPWAGFMLMLAMVVGTMFAFAMLRRNRS